MEEREAKAERKEDAGFTTELFAELKNTIKFQWGVICVLIAIITVITLYHEYQWSQFDTVIVDSGDGSGNANYIGNDGDANNYGESGGSQEKEVQQEKIERNKN